MWRRPWVWLGVSSLVVVLIVACLFLSTLARVQREHAALVELESLGCEYEYHADNDFELPIAWQFPTHVNVTIRLPQRDLPRVLMLMRGLSDIRGVAIFGSGRRLPSGAIDELCRHRQITHLKLYEVGLNHAEALPLLELPALTELALTDAELTDAFLKELDRCPQLAGLNVAHCPMTYATLLAWSNAHPKCRLQWEPRLTEAQVMIVSRLRASGLTVNKVNTQGISPLPMWEVLADNATDRYQLWRDLRLLGGVSRLHLRGSSWTDHDLATAGAYLSPREFGIRNASITLSGLQRLQGWSELDRLWVYDCDVLEGELASLRFAKTVWLTTVNPLGPHHVGPRRRGSGYMSAKIDVWRSFDIQLAPAATPPGGGYDGASNPSELTSP